MLNPLMQSDQTLIIDGDDTLWENNIYFEQAIEDFIDFLQHSRLSRAAVRAVLDEVEHLNSRLHGYGSAAFARNLRETFERLAERDIQQADIDHVMGLARRIVREELEILPGVQETLDALKTRHRLLLFTKGELEEQRLKVDRSGLADRFERVIVAREKDAAAYRELLRDCDVDPGRGWMIGNSPRSDILPALDVGLRAVYIPHAHTWSLEHADVPSDDPRLLVLRAFAELTQHF
jgi:putative hydrolase of the HAD superfamily